MGIEFRAENINLIEPRLFLRSKIQLLPIVANEVCTSV
jgi:hypothetical protein